MPRLIGYLNAFSHGMSGGDACFVEIMRRLKGYDLVVVTSSIGEEVCRQRGLDATFWITSRETLFRHVILTYVLRTANAIRMLVRVKEGDLVYASSDFLPDVLPAFLATFLRRDVRWVQRTFHKIPRSRLLPHLAQRVSYWLIRMRADRVITDNSMLRQDWIDSGTSPDKVSVSYPGIDVRLYRSKPEAPAKGYDAVCLGRLHRSKGVFDLITIWSRVCELRPHASLALIGRGTADVVHELQLEISSRHLDSSVKILGFLDTPEVIATLYSSRVLACPSREEGFGMVVLEAVAAGLPVVAWNLSVYDEVFPEGMVKTPIGDHERFARKVVELLDDPAARCGLALAAEDMVEGYDWSRITDGIESLLKDVRRA